MATVQMSEENTWGSIVSCAAAHTETATLWFEGHFESEHEWNSFRLPETGRPLDVLQLEDLLPQHGDQKAFSQQMDSEVDPPSVNHPVLSPRHLSLL